jgi:aspartyl-tRNA(Asn)/glutamyl-tRNA(Gln) amidotransferase subunit A
MKNLSIFETVSKIKNGEIKSENLVAQHLQLAKTLGQELNAFITIIEDAIEKAKEIDQRIANGEQLGKLAGIPCTVKDVIMTEGIRTTASSQMLANFVAPYSATVVKKLEQEGAIIIGKTNCDPFAFGASGENSGFGPVLNPLNRSKVPGGSSSGAAAAQAAGIGMFAIGTDTGGSIRQPASLCGLVGLKVTYGRNSRHGLIAMASSFDTPGIIANSVEDAALVQSIIAGKDPNDATTYDIPVEDYFDILQQNYDLKGLRIGVPQEYFELGINEDVKQTVQSAIEKLKQQGAEIINISIPLLKYGVSVYYVLVPSEISSNMGRYDGVRYGQKLHDDYEKNISAIRGKYLESEVKRRIMIGTYALSAGYADEFYKKATKVRVKLKQEIDKVFENIDVLVGPTSPTVAFDIGEKSDDPLAMYLADVYTVTANIVGYPALSLNCGYNDENLPIGIQFMTPRFSESKLLQIANKAQKILNNNYV